MKLDSMTPTAQAPRATGQTNEDLSLEDFYGAVAQAIDAAGPKREALMLSKLTLLLAHELGDAARAVELVEQARQDLG